MFYCLFINVCNDAGYQTSVRFLTNCHVSLAPIITNTINITPADIIIFLVDLKAKCLLVLTEARRLQIKCVSFSSISEQIPCSNLVTLSLHLKYKTNSSVQPASLCEDTISSENILSIGSRVSDIKTPRRMFGSIKYFA